MKQSAKRLAPLLISLLAGSSSVNAQTCPASDKCPYKNMQEAINTLLSRESQHEWQKIQWRTSAAEALRDAQRQSKPIFVFFVVKQQAPSPTKWTGQANDTGQT
jgi:hypothetical protein